MLEHLDIIPFLGLIVLAYFTGRWAEWRHYQSIRRRERAFLTRPSITVKTLELNTDRATS